MSGTDSTRQAGWEDSTTELGSGSADPFEAAWFLTRSRWWTVVRDPRVGPLLLGALLAILIVLAVLLSPSSDSRFIYTDF